MKYECMKYFLGLLLFPFALSAQSLYPVGDEFPLGLYALYTEHAEVSQDGWNCGHTYQESPVSDAYFNLCADNDLAAMARLSYIDSIGEKWSQPAAVTVAEIEQQAAQTNAAWWDIPEELRYWYDNEFEIVQNYTALTRAHDPQQRPNFMYIPGHYGESGIKNYVEYLDILPASCYPNWQEWSHAYVRWNIEQTQQAVLNEGYVLGPDYLSGEKTVFSILELFEGDIPLTVEGTRHDFWLSLACDAKGILVFSHFYRNESPTLTAAWNALNAEVEIFQNEGMGEAQLWGESIDLTTEIIAGATTTPAFTPETDPVIFPAVKTSAKLWNDTLFVLSVNSAEAETIFDLTNLPADFTAYRDVFSGTNTNLIDSNLRDTLPALGVGFYKFYTNAVATENIAK